MIGIPIQILNRLERRLDDLFVMNAGVETEVRVTLIDLIDHILHQIIGQLIAVAFEAVLDRLSGQKRVGVNVGVDVRVAA